jgi:arylsulfatase A-like enzyme
MPKKTFRHLLALFATALLAACSGGGDGIDTTAAAADPPGAGAPNILFIVLDDFGLDQMTAYGYGGAIPPKTPNLTAIAEAGLKFRNAWAMPTCTPTRATFFTGRYPSSTNVLNAVVETDLANSEISPYEVTLPKLLKTRGYTSALIGKMHLTGTDLNGSPNLPYGHQTMAKLGWDYFEGYLDGAPYPIDTRAGLKNVAAGTYQCGFVSNTTVGGPQGADTGTCYFADGRAERIDRAPGIPTPGRTCMERGGIFDPNQPPQAAAPSYIDFAAQNGYYTGEFVQSWADGRTRKTTAEDPAARGYRTTMETDRAAAWARQQPKDKPWMLTVGYSAIHTPLQMPPRAMISDDTLFRNDNLPCSPASDFEGAGPVGAQVLAPLVDQIDARIMTNLMVEALDREIGRLLVELNLATGNGDGTISYQPEKTDTVVVVMGDNGTFVNSVKFTAPGRFDPPRSKGSPYQTGVAVPLLVAGPPSIVKAPGREVAHQVSSPDLYQLFAEITGADAQAAVPAQRPLDAQPMRAYLSDPGASPIRRLNFAEMGTNFTNPNTAVTPQPCVIPAANACIMVFPNKALCEDQSGVWYGQGSGLEGIPEAGFSHCGQAMAYRNDGTTVLPDAAKAVGDGTYKLVRMTRKAYQLNIANPIDTVQDGHSVIDEFYRIDMAATPDPVLDREGSEIGIGPAPLTGLSGEARQAYEALSAEMDRRDAAAEWNANYDEKNCPGDGNRDGVVNQADLDHWRELSQLNGGQSSWYDLNHDGRTDQGDQDSIPRHLGQTCRNG